MKTGLILSVALATVCLGCGKSNDNRIVDLEKRIAALEGRLAMVERRSFDLGMRMPVRRMEGKKDDAVSRRPPLTPEQIAERQRLRENVRKRLEDRRDKARAKKQSGEGMKEPVKEPAAE